jgi:hypothetical protein
MARISTVNVLEFADDQIVSLASYPETPEGNKEAEQRFKDVAHENTAYSAADIESAIDDGIIEDATYKVVLFHSTEE